MKQSDNTVTSQQSSSLIRTKKTFISPKMFIFLKNVVLETTVSTFRKPQSLTGEKDIFHFPLLGETENATNALRSTK